MSRVFQKRSSRADSDKTTTAKRATAAWGSPQGAATPHTVELLHDRTTRRSLPAERLLIITTSDVGATIHHVLGAVLAIRELVRDTVLFPTPRADDATLADSWRHGHDAWSEGMVDGEAAMNGHGLACTPTRAGLLVSHIRCSCAAARMDTRCSCASRRRGCGGQAQAPTVARGCNMKHNTEPLTQKFKDQRTFTPCSGTLIFKC